MKQFLVIGLGDFGREVALALTAQGGEVIVVDNNERAIENIKDSVAQALVLNSTDEAALRSIGLENIDTAIVAIGEHVEASILTTAILKDLGVERIIARANTQRHAKILERVGAERIISPEVQIARQVARSLLAHHILERVELTENHSLVSMHVPHRYWGQKIIHTGIRRDFNIMIIGIERKIPEVNDRGEVVTRTKFLSIPGPNDVLKEEDIILVVGQNDAIDRLAVLNQKDNEKIMEGNFVKK